VNISESGTLIDLIGVSNIEKVKELTLSGDLNGTDILAIRKMINLETLDISESNIVEGGASYYESYTTSLNKIGDYFFKEKANLSTILLPKTVTSIGNYTFEGCVSLKSISIPNNIITIDNNAFSGCIGLTVVKFEDGDTTLSLDVENSLSNNNIFKNCPIETLYLGRNISYYSSKSPFRDKTSLTNLTISHSVTSIKNAAFAGCSGLTFLNIPNSVKIIEDAAFWGCGNISSLTIPNSVTFIGFNAFSGSCSFGCSNLTEIILEDGDTTLEFGKSANSTLPNTFAYCPIETLYLGRNISYYSDKSPFRDKVSLTNLTISLSVTSIENSAFTGCKGLTGTLAIPNSVTSIGNYAFQDCSGLTGTLTIPNSVISMGNCAFQSCKGLTDVKLEDGITPLSFGNTFAYCFIKTLYLGRNMPNSGSPFKDMTSLSELTISNFVTSIGDYAFSGCSGLTGTLTIPNSVTSIGNYAFQDCSGLTGTLTIPNSVISIGNSAFYGCSGLTGVLAIPNSVTLIGGYAFYGCSGLTGTLIIPNSVTSIGNSTFQGCSGLTGTLTIPNSVTSIGNYAFYGCGGLTEILSLPNSITSIGDYSFQGCNSLTDLIIPKSVISIGYSAFYGCSGLIDIKLEDGITLLSFKGNDVFAYCPIETLYLGRNISSGSLIFKMKHTLAHLTIGDYVFSIGNQAFYGCDGLIDLIISNSVTSIGSQAFYGCSRLTGTLAIPNSVTSIGDYSFQGCNSLTDLIISNSVIFIGNYTFSECNGLKSLTIPNSITSIGDNAFNGCTNLAEINSQNPIPPKAQSTTFEGVDKETCILYVPTGSVTTYWLHPVWEDFFNIKEKDFPVTSINTINADSDINAYTTDEGLKIEGCDFNDKVSIYTISGQMICNSIVGDGIIAYPFQKGSVYIIKTPKKALKIIY